MISEFSDNPVKLTFTLKNEVENWDNLRMYYIDENGDKAEEVATTYNSDTNEVYVHVTHFSIYGVFKVKRKTIPDDETPNDNDGKIPGNGESSGREGQTPNNGGVAPSDNDETSDKGEAPKNNEGSDINKDHQAKKDEDEAKELPNTSANMFNLLLIGLVIILLGGSGFFIAQKRKRA